MTERRQKKVVIRADASLQIGIGHVMRCLTLADALKARGADCHFICREHLGNLIELIRDKGHVVHVLPVLSATGASQTTAHSHWLGATQEQDSAACLPIVDTLNPDWLIVDHYALDANWELALKPYFQKLLVIDDLADRPHQCDLLLDQTFGRNVEDYRAMVPTHCRVLCGSEYALLRPEFGELRSYSLQRRAEPQLKNLLISMGGVDKDNLTGQVLKALKKCSLPLGCQVTVVMGPTAPWLSEVNKLAKDLPWTTRVHVGVSNMAGLMADSDLAIGAAGASSWERCCLGLPAILILQAQNQAFSLQKLLLNEIVWYLPADNIATKINEVLAFACEKKNLKKKSFACQVVTDGCGTEKIIFQLWRAFDE